MKTAPTGFNNFQNAICMKNGWPKDSYEQKVLWESIHGKSKFLARLIYAVRPKHFERDLELIRDLASANSLLDFKERLSTFKTDTAQSGFLRKKLGVRASGSRLLKLGSRFFN